MGYNTHTYDKEAEYAKKSTKQLQAELKKFEQVVADWIGDISPARFNEHIGYLKMKIAERIGKK